MNFRIIVLLVSLVACVSSAAVQPAGLFADNAVLQRDAAVRIWGRATPGETVTVLFAEQSKETVAGDDGRWRVVLDQMPACSEGRSLVMRGSETSQPVELENILVGEVWLAGGQSNMVVPMKMFRKTTQADIDRADDSLLRITKIGRKDYDGQNAPPPRWSAATPECVAEFSAGAYYFARNLRASLNVPVGIIVCAVSGTPAETWMSRDMLESKPDLKRVLDAYDAGFVKDFGDEAGYQKRVEAYRLGMDEWNRRRAARQKPNPRPAEPMGPFNKNRPCGLYGTMLTQVIPCTIRGVIWYQGEENAMAPAGFHYRSVFPALIQGWRNEFENPDLPFLFVQLAACGPASDRFGFWPELRESQCWTEEHVDNTGMIVLADGGDEKNIHPASKDKVGLRLSLLARNLVYGETDLICRGPQLLNLKRGKDFIELEFKESGSKPVLKPLAESAFEICGPDGRYVPAKAELIDQRLVISSEEVADPQHVRYGWRKWFVPTLFNQEGLPASPFRTDDFPAETKDRYYLDR